MMRREKEEEKGKGFMEWDWKSPSWDFAELERETKSNIITPIIRSSSLGGGKQTSHEDFSFDLKLGRLEEIGGSGQMTQWKDPRVSMTPSPLSSSKKARAPSYETQTVSCLVEGCDSDLSKYRDYYRRHKVCEDHSKTPKVMVAGQEQRFCQQCSRFHLLSEFDEVKRSCRKRLDGHNRRRRKSQSDSFSMNSGGLFSNLQGTKYLSFSSPQLLQSSNLIDGQNQFPGSVSSNFNEGKQSLFMNINDPGRGFQKGAHEVSFCQPLFNTVASSSRNSEASRKMFSDRFSNGVGLDSDSALSLLSSAPNCQRSEISPGNHSYIVHPNSIPVGRPIEGGIVAEGLPYAALVAPADSGLHISHTGLTEQQQHQLPYQGSILYTGLDGSLGHGPAQTFPFAWE